MKRHGPLHIVRPKRRTLGHASPVQEHFKRPDLTHLCALGPSVLEALCRAASAGGERDGSSSDAARPLFRRRGLRHTSEVPCEWVISQ